MLVRSFLITLTVTLMTSYATFSSTVMVIDLVVLVQRDVSAWTGGKEFTFAANDSVSRDRGFDRWLGPNSEGGVTDGLKLEIFGTNYEATLIYVGRRPCLPSYSLGFESQAHHLRFLLTKSLPVSVEKCPLMLLIKILAKEIPIC